MLIAYAFGKASLSNQKTELVTRSGSALSLTGGSSNQLNPRLSEGKDFHYAPPSIKQIK
jgi:hypothetical protein